LGRQQWPTRQVVEDCRGVDISLLNRTGIFRTAPGTLFTLTFHPTTHPEELARVEARSLRKLDYTTFLKSLCNVRGQGITRFLELQSTVRVEWSQYRFGGFRGPPSTPPGRLSKPMLRDFKNFTFGAETFLRAGGVVR
jgi:hypothetical protein